MKLVPITRREFLRRTMLALTAIIAWRPGRELGRGAREQGSRGAKEVLPLHPCTPAHPRALSPHEYVTVAAIAAIIVPTDDDPGATEADVADYIDRKASSDAALRQRYAEGVQWMDRASAKLFGRGRRFIDLGLEQQMEVLKAAEATLQMRLRPVASLWQRLWRKVQKTYDDLFGLGEGATFFRFVREDTLQGFYTNPISWSMLGYIGPPQPRGYPHYEDCPPQGRR